jgi:hypothetical protein
MSLCFLVWAQREVIGAWTVFREFDPITDGNTSWMYIDAWDQPVGVTPGGSALVVRCNEASGLDVYVSLDLDQARLTPNEYYNATYRMDRGDTHEVRGHASTDGRGLFLAYSDFGTFVAEAKAASNFAIRIWDDEGEALTYQMDISGFAEAYAYAGFGDTCLDAPDLSDPDPELGREWESVGAWQVARRIDPITDENTSAMISPAWDLPAGIELGDSALIVNCDVGIFVIYVVLDDQERLTPFTGDEYYNATYRMDKGETHLVRGSSNGKVFHFFVADRWERGARTFVREAVDAENFTFRIRDDRGTLLTYQMDITGFAEAYEYAGFDCLFAPDLATIAPAPAPPQTYTLDALVEPDNLSPVTLFVLESPEGSKFTPGSSLGYVPQEILFDQPGTWRLEGRFQGLRSPEIVITIPDDRSFIVKIPAYAGIGRWQWIKQATSNGSMVTLGDGSQWQIRPGTDRSYSRRWQSLTSVEVGLAQSPIDDYPYTLTADGRVVHAKYLGQGE